jgi:putative NADH-flavin reductase
MKVFLLGATGGTGEELQKQACLRNHQVTAFVRSPEKIAGRDERLTVIGGNPRNANELAAAMVGHDVVLSALGPRSNHDDALLPDCTRSIIEAMVRSGVRRVLVMSAALLFPDLGFFPAGLLRFLIRGSLRGAREAERLLMESDLTWTIVRPGRLINGPLTREYRSGSGYLPPKPRAIARADVAHFLVDELERRAHQRAIVGLCR